MPDKDIALMAHLMRRAGFGAHRDELERRLATGYEQTVEELLDPEKHDIPEVDEEVLFRYMPNLEYCTSPRLGRMEVIYRMMNSQRPLEEKMSLFWHQLFATGEAKINKAQEMVDQMALFRKYGMGSYQELLVELARNPAMIYWLDNNENHKDAPNENWGRELLELFSLGVGNYTEQDVYECSRAFTGWTITDRIPRGGPGYFPWGFGYVAEDHDDTEKQFLGHKGRFNGEDIVDIVVGQTATHQFIARHLYNFFVADEVQVPAWQDTPPKDPDAVNAIVDAFVKSGYDMRSTLRVLFNSDFFKEARFARVKSPIEVVVGTMRLVGDFKSPRPGILAIGEETGYQGQELINPPSVEGWHTGAEWIDSGSLVRRINFAADWLSNLEMPGVQSIIGRTRAQGNLASPEFVDICLDLLGPLEVADSTRQELISMAERGGELCWDSDEDSRTSAGRVADMLALIAAAREYQMA